MHKAKSRPQAIKSPCGEGNLDYPDEYEQDLLFTKLHQQKAKVKFI